MAKLYFRHGTVGSAKTLNLLAVAHNYRQQGKKVSLLKPKLDTRFGKETIKSRAGLYAKADVLIEENTTLDYKIFKDISCILVDEAQFLSVSIINQLRMITINLDIPVICYGLRTDFRSNLFDASKRLIELSDTIEEIKCTCNFCRKKSIMNLKHVDGVATVEGPTIQLGTEEMYFPACFSCYSTQVENAKALKKKAKVN
jgi:thymidine kinase